MYLESCLVRWWSERGRDVYRSGKTRFCHVPTTGHCRCNMHYKEVKGDVLQQGEGVSVNLNHIN